MKIKSLIALTLLACGNASLIAAGIPIDTPCGNNANGDNSCPVSTPHSVNVYTGNEQRQIDDLQVWGGVGEHQLEWSRYGNSRFSNAVKTFGNGFGWRHSYQWEMTATGSDASGPKTIDLYYPNGTHNTFTRTTTPGSTFTSYAYVTDILYLNGTQDTFTLQRQTGYQYVFSLVTIAGVHHWRLNYFLDTQQNAYTFTYNSSNQLIKISEPGGRYLSITYAVLTYNNENQTSMATVSAPVAGWNTIASSGTNAYRYWRYQGPDGWFSPVAEIQFLDGTGSQIAGTPFGSGTPPVSGQDFTKAFDGDTTTSFISSIQAGDYVGFDLGTKQSVASFKFFPPAGNESAMKNGHFYGSNQQPSSITVISKVQTSDGRSVTYNYQQFNDPSLPFSWQTLIGATYGDGTAAAYTYQQEYPGTPPLVVQAIDPRVHGQGTNLKWVYDVTNTNLIGFVHQEQDGVTGQPIVTFSFTQHGNTISPVANNANGGSDIYNVWEPTTLLNSKTDSLGHTTSYTYDQSGAGFLIGQKDALGRTTNYTNTIYDNPLTQTNPDGSVESWTRDSLDLVLTHTDELGHVTTYTRDAYHRVTQITYPDTTFETFVYNSFGKVTLHHLRNGGTESNTYDSTGLKLSHTDALGNITAYTYDGNNRLASVTDANNHATLYQYNERGNLLKSTYADGSFTVYTYDLFGDQTSITNEIGNIWATTYDEWKRKTSITDPLGRITTWSYALPGGGCACGHSEVWPTLITLPSGKATSITYDAKWQVTSITSGFGSPDAATTNIAYDLVGNVVMVTNPKGNAWHTSYDNRERATTSTDPLGHSTQFTYDLVGNKLTTTRPDGGVITNTYDVQNRLASTANPLNQTTYFAYDNADNLINVTDANSHAYSYAYDLKNRKISAGYPDGSQELFSYDPVNNLATYTNRSAQIDTYTYDTRNRNVNETWSAGAPSITRTFDFAGRLLTLNNTVSALAYSYDVANQLTAETQNLSGINPSLSTKTINYAYDADGNQSSLTYPAGDVINYSYTGRNQLAALTIDGSSPMANFSYDINGNRLSKTLENSTSVNYVYDAADRLTNVSHILSGILSPLASFSYNFNSVNNRTNRVETSGTLSSLTDSYSYDSANEITGVAYASGRNVSYGYDAVGNRSSVIDTGTTSSYTVNNLNQYTAIGGVGTPDYDGNGNLKDYNGWIFGYDALNRLTSASNATNTVTFSYDARNRCVSRTVNGTKYYLLYDRWNLIEERDASDTQLAYYVHGPHTDEMLARITVAGPKFYHEDGLGNVTMITDSTGNVVERYAYDVFGTVAIMDSLGNPLTTSSFGNRFLFTGRELLPSLGIYDYRNRIYAPGIGRFLQTDPLRINAGDINIYRYVNNNAVNARDPRGLQEGTSDFDPNADAGAEYYGQPTLDYEPGDNPQNDPLNGDFDPLEDTDPRNLANALGDGPDQLTEFLENLNKQKEHDEECKRVKNEIAAAQNADNNPAPTDYSDPSGQNSSPEITLSGGSSPSSSSSYSSVPSSSDGSGSQSSDSSSVALGNTSGSVLTSGGQSPSY